MIGSRDHLVEAWNKVESKHRKFKSSSNKTNHVSGCNVNVKNVAMSKNFANVCLSCNECLFSTNHDACVVQHLNDVQKCKKAQSVKPKEMFEWKPTIRIFKSVGLKWVPTSRMFNLVKSQCSSSPSQNTTTKMLPNRKIPTTTIIPANERYTKLRLRFTTTGESLYRLRLKSEFHPFNINDFGLEGILANEDHPP
ncbi:hypothetical protein Tco_0040320 [Tanacetum coccineum]